MSKKNLSRSALEGGRRPYNRWDRGQSNREQRALERTFVNKAKVDDEYPEYQQIERRRKVHKEFDDKLGPMYKWLRSHVGQPWDNVRSKATKMYDDRTTAGRHILYDHLISSVQVTPDPNPKLNWYRDFYVDDNGILTLGERNRWNRRTIRRQDDAVKYPGGPFVKISEKEILAWAGSRRVIDYGASQFWTTEPTRYSWRVCTHRGYLVACPYESKQVPTLKRTTWVKSMDDVRPAERARYIEKDGAIYVRGSEWHCYGAVFAGLAQGIKFNKEEADFWRRLHPRKKSLIMMEVKDTKGRRR